MNILYLFTFIYVCFAASAASPAPTHPSVKGIHNSGAGAEGARPTVVEAAEGRLLDGWLGWAGEAADAAKHAYTSNSDVLTRVAICD